MEEISSLKKNILGHFIRQTQVAVAVAIIRQTPKHLTPKEFAVFVQRVYLRKNPNARQEGIGCLADRTFYPENSPPVNATTKEQVVLQPRPLDTHAPRPPYLPQPRTPQVGPEPLQSSPLPQPRPPRDDPEPLQSSPLPQPRPPRDDPEPLQSSPVPHPRPPQVGPEPLQSSPLPRRPLQPIPTQPSSLPRIPQPVSARPSSFVQVPLRPSRPQPSSLLQGPPQPIPTRPSSRPQVPLQSIPSQPIHPYPHYPGRPSLNPCRPPSGRAGPRPPGLRNPGFRDPRLGKNSLILPPQVEEFGGPSAFRPLWERTSVTPIQDFARDGFPPASEQVRGASVLPRPSTPNEADPNVPHLSVPKDPLPESSYTTVEFRNALSGLLRILDSDNNTPESESKITRSTTDQAASAEGGVTGTRAENVKSREGCEEDKLNERRPGMYSETQSAKVDGDTQAIGPAMYKAFQTTSSSADRQTLPNFQEMCPESLRGLSHFEDSGISMGDSPAEVSEESATGGGKGISDEEKRVDDKRKLDSGEENTDDSGVLGSDSQRMTDIVKNTTADDSAVVGKDTVSRGSGRDGNITEAEGTAEGKEERRFRESIQRPTDTVRNTAADDLVIVEKDSLRRGPGGERDIIEMKGTAEEQERIRLRGSRIVVDASKDQEPAGQPRKRPKLEEAGDVLVHSVSCVLKFVRDELEAELTLGVPPNSSQCLLAVTTVASLLQKEDRPVERYALHSCCLAFLQHVILEKLSMPSAKGVAMEGPWSVEEEKMSVQTQMMTVVTRLATCPTLVEHSGDLLVLALCRLASAVKGEDGEELRLQVELAGHQLCLLLQRVVEAAVDECSQALTWDDLVQLAMIFTDRQDNDIEWGFFDSIAYNDGHGRSNYTDYSSKNINGDPMVFSADCNLRQERSGSFFDDFTSGVDGQGFLDAGKEGNLVGRKVTFDRYGLPSFSGDRLYNNEDYFDFYDNRSRMWDCDNDYCVTSFNDMMYCGNYYGWYDSFYDSSFVDSFWGSDRSTSNNKQYSRPTRTSPTTSHSMPAGTATLEASAPAATSTTNTTSATSKTNRSARMTTATSTKVNKATSTAEAMKKGVALRRWASALEEGVLYHPALQVRPPRWRRLLEDVIHRCGDLRAVGKEPFKRADQETREDGAKRTRGTEEMEIC